MKKNRHIFPFLAVGLLILPILESCRTEICYNHFPVADISLSWEQEWERDYGLSYSLAWDKTYYGFDYNEIRPETPEWVSLIRYSEDGSVSNEKYFSPKGGQLILNSETDKSFLFYNGDTEYIVLSDLASMNQARATATTRTRASISYIMERHPGVRSMNPPDVLFSAYLNPIPHVEIHQTKEMPVKMQPLVYTYIIRYEFEEGIEHVALSRGALAGMAESVYLRDGRTSDETAIILYDCEVKPYGCEARVRSFGVPGFPDKYYGRASSGEPEGPYTLNLEVMLKNGKTVEFNYDIADQMKKQPRGGVIKVNGICIKDSTATPDPVSSGFDVDLNGWGNGEDVELPMDPIEPLD
ncbi:MAG: DUF5119 domain-containing protein [Muribaculaceae bacterium]|nr:DUF5119 domain-containing protein [Muribaculaceae bacterium]